MPTNSKYTPAGIRASISELAKYQDLPLAKCKSLIGIQKHVEIILNGITSLYSGDAFHHYQDEIVDHIQTIDHKAVMPGTLASFLFQSLPTKTLSASGTIEPEKQLVEEFNNAAQTWMFDPIKNKLEKHTMSYAKEAIVYSYIGDLSSKHANELIKAGIDTVTTYGSDGKVIQHALKLKEYIEKLAEKSGVKVKRGWNLWLFLILVIVIIVAVIVLLIVFIVMAVKRSKKEAAKKGAASQ